MRTNIKILILLLVSGFSYAQQDSQFTQYMYNTISINPAYAGSRDTFSVFALHRSQWIGLDGAPQTNNVSVNTPIKDTNVGIGVSIINDKIGPSDENNIAVDFSYTIPTSDNFKLSFGLKASANLLNIDFNKLSQYDNGDTNLATNIDNKFSPNIGLGFYLHSEDTYVGLSIPYLLDTKHFDRYANTGSSSNLAKQDIAYYLTVGHVFELNENLKFKPSVLTKLIQGAPVGFDFSANFLINEKFVAGASYRLNAAVSGLLGFQATDSWFIGYSYDFDTTGLSNYNSGSHELFLRFEIFNRYSKIYSPRFF
jgi:type IX secretion system PorP/SprF family membrane protein